MNVDACLSARDALEAALARIADPAAGGAHVFTKLYPEAARAAADAADARAKAGLSLGPLDGKIVSIKDLFDVAGETTTAGSKILKGTAPAQADAPIVARLRRAGAVIIGKTNMSEFAFSGIGINPHWGTPGNAADRTRVPGGSSSGAGVSVGEGTSEIAIGTDTGGSIRIPASLNGVVGFKPTADRVPTTGAFPLSYTLDSIGPLARTVQACADTDAVLAGEEPWTVEPAPLSGLRVAIPRGRLLEGGDAHVETAFEAAVAALEKEGARVVDLSIEDLLDKMTEALNGAPLVPVEAAAVHAAWLETRKADFDPRVHARIARGATVPAPAYVAMLRQRRALIAAMQDRLADFDILALPATPVPAPRIADLVPDDETFFKYNALMLRNTSVGNFFAQCGVSLPMPVPGLPAGLMLMGCGGQDKRVLRIAKAVEAVLA